MNAFKNDCCLLIDYAAPVCDSSGMRRGYILTKTWKKRLVQKEKLAAATYIATTHIYIPDALVHQFKYAMSIPRALIKSCIKNVEHQISVCRQGSSCVCIELLSGNAAVSLLFVCANHSCRSSTGVCISSGSSWYGCRYPLSV